MEGQRELIYAVYQSSTTDKYYVKYRDTEEREITKADYLQLLDEKERILEAKIKKQ
jgi:hypothetical protein